MAGRKLSLQRPDVAAVIDETYRRETDPRRKLRLQAMSLVASGQHNSSEVAEICGISRGHLFEWLKQVRRGGLEELLADGVVGRPEGWRKDASPEVVEQFETGLLGQEFGTIEQARRWLLEEHGLDLPYTTVWYWAKKARWNVAGVTTETRRNGSGGGEEV